MVGDLVNMLTDFLSFLNRQLSLMLTDMISGFIHLLVV